MIIIEDSAASGVKKKVQLTNTPISSATQTALNAKEPTITSGTTSQYYRGDKTFQTLDKTAVGLSNVDNTSDTNKPVSTATQTALNGKENNITATTSADYYRGDKTFQPLNKAAVGLGNVDNTSDATKNSAIATLTNKTIDYNNNTLQNIPLAAGGLTQPTISGNTSSGVLTIESMLANLYSTSDQTGDIKKYTIAATNSLSALSPNTYYYLYVDYTGGNPAYAITTDNTIITHSNKIAVAQIY